MTGSKREARGSWLHGRGRGSLRGDIRFSVKKNKRMLARRARRCFDMPDGGGYRKLAKDAARDRVQ